MKKTLIALLALSSLAVAEDFTTNVMQTGNYNNNQWNYTTTQWGSKNILTLSNTEMAVDITNGVSAYCTTNNDYTNSMAVANTNAGNGGTYNYTLSFTTSFGENVESITLSSITIDFFSVSAGGQAQSADDKPVKATNVSLVQGEQTLVSGANITTTIPKGNANKAVYTGNAENGYQLATGETPGQLVFDLNGATLQNNTTYTLTLGGVTKNGGGGTLYGMGNVALAGTYTTSAGPVVPEPATGSLSLLALAGLCARRRRK